MIADEFLRYLAAERDASHYTVQFYAEALGEYQKFLDDIEDGLKIEDADADLIRTWVESLMDKGLKPASVNLKLSAVRSLYKFALRKGAVKKDPAHAVTGPKKEKTLPTFLKESEADRLFDELDWNMDDIYDVRARTIILLLYSTGIRRSELLGLRDKDVNFLTREIKVTGKRRKQRIVPLGEEILEELRRYIDMRNETVEWAESTEEDEGQRHLFVTNNGKPLTESYVYTLVRKYLSLVTTQKKRSPHVLRHTFATAMLNNDAKLGSVQKLLGHASLNTTQVYTHVTFEELKRTYKKAHPRAED